MASFNVGFSSWGKQWPLFEWASLIRDKWDINEGDRRQRTSYLLAGQKDLPPLSSPFNTTASFNPLERGGFKINRWGPSLPSITEPGADQGCLPFRKRFVDDLQGAETIRFMDWGRTNASPITHWEDRARISNLPYTNDKGVPIELMLELASFTGSTAWICVPHLSTPTFWAKLGKLLWRWRHVPIILEWSNEAGWNSQFPQFHWAANEHRQGQRVAGVSDRDAATLESVLRTEWMSSVVRQYRKDVKVVIASQCYEPTVTDRIYENLSHGLIDGIALAPYVGQRITSDLASAISDEKLFAEMFRQINDELIPALEEHRAIVERSGYLEIFWPEAGQSLILDDRERLRRLNDDDRMAVVYGAIEDACGSVSGSKPCWYTHTRDTESVKIGGVDHYNDWGLRRHEDETGPKWEAVVG